MLEKWRASAVEFWALIRNISIHVFLISNILALLAITTVYIGQNLLDKNFTKGSYFVLSQTLGKIRDNFILQVIMVFYYAIHV